MLIPQSRMRRHRQPTVRTSAAPRGGQIGARPLPEPPWRRDRNHAPLFGGVVPVPADGPSATMVSVRRPARPPRSATWPRSARRERPARRTQRLLQQVFDSSAPPGWHLVRVPGERSISSSPSASPTRPDTTTSGRPVSVLLQGRHLGLRGHGSSPNCRASLSSLRVGVATTRQCGLLLGPQSLEMSVKNCHVPPWDGRGL